MKKKNDFYTKEDIIRMADEEDVEFIRLQFTDIFGTLKNVAITRNQLERALNNDCMFDGSAIEGFVRVEESDMYLYPDLKSFTILPWRPQEGKVARIICDVYTADRKPFIGDPRHALQRVVEATEKEGYELNVGSECEFFLFDTDNEGNPTVKTQEHAGYFDTTPLDCGENARRDMVMTLEEMGYEVEASHHEIAPAQQEIDFKYEPSMHAADNIMTFKLTVKTIAKRRGLYATFMPKPLYGVNGSGMHINMSLEKGGKNLFYDPSSEDGLSQDLLYFIGGLMKHIRAITAIANPLVNSYKRLVPGYDAPIYIAWSKSNRSPLIRVPSERGDHTRIELRSPDPSANPYLVIAVCLAAGMDGIRNRITPPASVEKNIFALTEEEKKAYAVERLPMNLKEALEGLKKDSFICDVLGEHILTKYIEAKEKEWNSFGESITDWEVKEYLGKY